MNHEKVAKAWRRQQPAKGPRMHSDGKVVYSYGSHWPIAVWLNGAGLVALNVASHGRSVSTRRHYHEVRSALRGSIVGPRIVDVNLEDAERAKRIAERSSTAGLEILECADPADREPTLVFALHKLGSYLKSKKPHMARRIKADLAVLEHEIRTTELLNKL